MITLDLLRHGETELSGGFRGSLDDALTDRGWGEMRAATHPAQPWTLVVSSPLRRCADFARELADDKSLPLVQSDGLRELHFGDWEGRHASELMEQHAEDLGRFWSDPYGFTPPTGEPVSDFAERVLQAVEQLRLGYAGEHLLVVTHGGVMRLLLARARGLPPGDMLQVEVVHGQLSRLQIDATGELHECPC